MVVRTLFDANLTPPTRLTLGFMTTTLQNRAVIMALFEDSAPSASDPSLRMQSSLSTPIIAFPVTPAPSASIFNSHVVTINAPFVNSPSCISPLMPPSCPLAQLHQHRHPDYHPHEVLFLYTLLDIYLLWNNYLYMLPHPSEINPLDLYFLFQFISELLFLLAQQLPNSETIMRLPSAYFSLRSAKMTLSGGRTTTVRVGDVVKLKDDHGYSVLKVIPPSGSIVLKRNDGSTYRSFLRASAHVLVSALQTVNQSTQTDPMPSTADDPLAHAILHYCGPNAVDGYHQGRPYCLRNVYWITLPGPRRSSSLLCGTQTTKKKAL